MQLHMTISELIFCSLAVSAFIVGLIFLSSFFVSKAIAVKKRKIVLEIKPLSVLLEQLEKDLVAFVEFLDRLSMDMDEKNCQIGGFVSEFNKLGIDFRRIVRVSIKCRDRKNLFVLYSFHVLGLEIIYLKSRIDNFHHLIEDFQKMVDKKGHDEKT